MARIRYINPEFFTDDRLAELPPLHRIFFSGMWCHADREGRLDDKPKQLKVKILPYDEIDADEILTSLDNSRLINRYCVDGNNYIQIINFLKYQRPHHTEKHSKIPAPNVQKTVKNTSKDGEKRAGMVNGEWGMGNDKGNGKTPLPPSQGDAVEVSKKSVSKKSETDYGFEEFWKAYPQQRRIGKGAARKSFLKIKPDAELLATMIAAIESAKKTEQWRKENGQFIPLPTTWLNQERWDDEHAAIDNLNSRTAANITELQRFVEKTERKIQ